MTGEKKTRCTWAGSDAGMIVYHDSEWGVPQHDDNKLFEFLILEGAQAGLAWQTVLNKREGYRKAFADFDPQRVARLTEEDEKKLLRNPEIIRNRLKIAAAVENARVFLEVQKEFGSFDAYLWRFVDGIPIRNARQQARDIPAKTSESEMLSRDLKRRGFRFVGPTICYAFMQAVGMVNDHTVDCFRYQELCS